MTYTYATDNRLLTRPTSTPACAEFRRYVTDQAGMRLAELDSLSGYAGLQSAMTYTAAGQLYYAVTPQAAAGPYDHAWHWYGAGGRRVMSHLASGSTLGASVRPDSTWGTRTYYLNDGDDVALTLVKGSGPTWRYHQRYLLTGLDEVAALRLSLNGVPTNLAVVSDRQGSFLMAVDAGGAEKTAAGFYLTGPFGQRESGSAAATDAGTHAGLGFTGAGTPTTSGGYVYLRNRWYDPQTGRFLSQDPIGLQGGVNLYAYAGNNPIAYSDPFGLCKRDDPTCPPLARAMAALKDRIGRTIDRIAGDAPAAVDAVRRASPGTARAAVASKVANPPDLGTLDYSISARAGPIGATIGTGGGSISVSPSLQFTITADATYTAPGRSSSALGIGAVLGNGLVAGGQWNGGSGTVSIGAGFSIPIGSLMPHLDDPAQKVAVKAVGVIGDFTSVSGP